MSSSLRECACIYRPLISRPRALLVMAACLHWLLVCGCNCDLLPQVKAITMHPKTHGMGIQGPNWLGTGVASDGIKNSRLIAGEGFGVR
jgi:hypothetical protein